ncbi:MAG: AAA family ATPase [Gammaproteobacteria bacterium]|nr:AAA family ATPase [Gammaproteobacteria bacterium]
MAIQRLTATQLHLATDDSVFNVSRSDELNPASPCMYQERAISAMQTALAVTGSGYHLMMIGGEGVGRFSCINSLLNEFSTANENRDNPDRILLPVRDRQGQYDEVELKPGRGRKLIHVCQQVVSATNNKDTEYQTLLIQELLGSFPESSQLTEYIHWLADFSLMLLAGDSTEFEYRELQQMIPLLLHTGRSGPVSIIKDPFIDTTTLLGTFTTDQDSSRKTVHAGSLVQASGGFLIIDGKRLIEDMTLWRILRDILASGLMPLDAMLPVSSSHSSSSMPLSGNIRLTCQVILVCDANVYEQFQAIETELEHLFPVIAEFESEMPRNDDNTRAMASIIAALIKQYNCLPLDKQALAAMLDIAVRQSGSRDHITLTQHKLSRILREASVLANLAGAKLVSRKIIKEVVQQERQRVLVDQRDAEQSILNGETQVDLKGKVIGQINGLTIVGSGEHSYLEPARLTATVRAGDGAVVDIEREVSLGGPLHSKGVLILTSLLAARYSRHVPLSMIASLVFEQSYAYVDGDSASAAEMMVILSAITEVPIKQSLAITGSIDQRGQILCIGDINRKIEGFYHLCKGQGVQDAGVVIPKTNLRDLMLDEEVVQAVADGSFTLYAVSALDDVIELFTDMDSGSENNRREFPAGSFNARVQESLKQFAEENKHDHKDD